MKDDDLQGDLPSIRVNAEERAGTSTVDQDPPLQGGVRAPVRPVAVGHGAFWAACVALMLALVWLGWWTYQQQASLQRQLVATQDSFARISEEASGRIQDITGKVSATESTLSEVERAREQRLQALDKQLQDLQQRLQASEQALQAVRSQQAASLQDLQTSLREADQLRQGLAEQLQQLQQRQQEQLGKLEQLQASQLQAQQELQQQLTALQVLPQQLQELREQLSRQERDLQRQQAAPDLAAELLILRSELDQRLASSEEALAAIDAFRLQTNRSLSAMQDQLRTLQGARQ